MSSEPPTWVLGGAGRPSAKTSGRRIRERTTSRGEAPFPRKVYGAEWDHPGRPGVVTRHWFSTRQEALDARQGPTPFAKADSRLQSTPRERWFL